MAADTLSSPRKIGGTASPVSSPQSVAAALAASQFADDFEPSSSSVAHDADDFVAPQASVSDHLIGS
jgi:hypothetical protein